MKVKYLIIGAGISGLSIAANADDYLVVEKENEIGGLCRTIKQNGYVWDYSGHFFHFKEPQLKEQFIDSIPSENLLEKEKKTYIFRKNKLIDFPFQKNIHQLDQNDFIDCLYDLYFREESESYSSFERMLYGKFGKSITEMFLKPYNEKLYACNLDSLEVDAMGRFFPYANMEEIIRNMKNKDNNSYNGSFLYPKGGAVTFVNLLADRIDPERIWLNCEVLGIDSTHRIAKTSKGDIEYEFLVNTAPLTSLCQILGIEHDNCLTSNKVLVFNMGFDKKSIYDNIHWMYFPEKKYNFYRVGFYDNILDQEKLSIYVEIGFEENQNVDINEELEKTIAGLHETGIISDHKLVDYCSILMNPAYVHICEKSEKFKIELFERLEKEGIFSIGRYGKWTYCSIEDCVLDAFDVLKKTN